MKSFPPEPLTPEERELAQLTARLGPQGEPSPALDSRILGAAHAALARKPVARQRPRWPVAMGLAASVVFAVGIAWQLRPLQPSPASVASEAPAEPDLPLPQPLPEPEAPDAAIVAAEQASPPPVAEDVADARRQDEVAESPAKAVAAPPAQVAAKRPEVQARRIRPVPAPATPVVSENRVAGQEPAPAPVAAAPPPPPSPAPAVTAADESPVAFSPGSRAEVAEFRTSTAETATAGAISTRAGNSRAAAGAAAGSARDAAAKSSSAHAQERESETLDRIEVTGSRLKRTDLQVPVSDDARLPVNEWLERVRTRYGLGDAGAAKKSLLLFVKDHPGEQVPDDLEPLLEE